jgi:NADH:ubiquinone oxidoreductase subunit 4 (subunit M)
VVEALTVSPLVVACVALGVAPWLLLSMTGPAVRELVGVG